MLNFIKIINSTSLLFQIDISSLIPKKFPGEIQKIIDDKGEMAESQKSFIVRLISGKLVDAGLDSPSVVLEMSILLTKAYPKYFKCPYGEDHVSL